MAAIHRQRRLEPYGSIAALIFRCRSTGPWEHCTDRSVIDLDSFMRERVRHEEDFDGSRGSWNTGIDCGSRTAGRGSSWRRRRFGRYRRVGRRRDYRRRSREFGSCLLRWTGLLCPQPACYWQRQRVGTVTAGAFVAFRSASNSSIRCHERQGFGPAFFVRREKRTDVPSRSLLLRLTASAHRLRQFRLSLLLPWKAG